MVASLVCRLELTSDQEFFTVHSVINTKMFETLNRVEGLENTCCPLGDLKRNSLYWIVPSEIVNSVRRKSVPRARGVLACCLFGPF